MKKQITILLLLLTAVGFTACKKAKGTYIDIIGKWQVVKIETTVAGTPAVTYTGTSADSFDFRDNEGNDLYVNLNGTNNSGHYYVLVGNGLTLNYGGKARSGQVTTISSDKLEFTVTVDGSSPLITEKFYFTR